MQGGTRDTAIFIDGAYFDKVQEHHGIRVDLNALVDRMLGGKRDRLFRVYYYNSTPYQDASSTPEEIARAKKLDGYYRAIRDLMDRLELRLTPSVLRIEPNGRKVLKQKGADVALATDCAVLAARGNINEAHLLAGDADFVPLVQMVRDLGVLVSLWHGPRSNNACAGQSNCTVSRDLLRNTDDRLELTEEILESVSLRNRSQSSIHQMTA